MSAAEQNVVWKKLVDSAGAEIKFTADEYRLLVDMMQNPDDAEKRDAWDTYFKARIAEGAWHHVAVGTTKEPA